MPWLSRAENCGVSAAAMVLGVVQFLDKVVVPFGATTGCGRIFTFFYMKGLTRLLSSVLVLRHIVDHGSGMFHAVFTGIDAPGAVFPSIVRRRGGEVYAADASVYRVARGFWTFFHDPSYLAVISAVRAFSQQSFLSPRRLTRVCCRGLFTPS